MAARPTISNRACPGSRKRTAPHARGNTAASESKRKGLRKAQALRHLATRSTNPAWLRPAAAGRRAGARCSAPNWSRCRPSRPRRRRATAHGRPRSRCRWTARSRRPRRARARSSAARMAPARGSDTAGLVAMTQSALISPRSIASNISHGLAAFAGSPCGAHSRSGVRGRSRRVRNPYGRPVDWRARPPRGPPWHWAGR